MKGLEIIKQRKGRLQYSIFQIVPQRLKGQNYKPTKVWMSHIWFKLMNLHQSWKGGKCLHNAFPSQSGDSVQEQHTQWEPSWSQMKILIAFWFTLNWILILLLRRFQISKSGKYLIISRRQIAHSSKESVW